MKRHRRATGFAMLLAIAAVVIAVSAAATLARLAASGSVAAYSRERAKQSTDLLTEADRLILTWISREAELIVLPPDVGCPAIPVADDMLHTDETSVGLRIIAIDQRGLLPWWLPLNADRLARTMDPADTRTLEQLTQPLGAGHFGISLHGDAAGPENTGQQTPMFPTFSKITTSRSIHRVGKMPQPEATQQHFSTSTEPTVLFARVAVEPSVVAAAGRREPIVINASTMPLDRLEAILSDLDVTSIPAIRQARLAGQQPTVAAVFERGASAPIRLVHRSDAWAFRVDISIDHEQRSWWLVYASTRNGWAMTQRWRIHG